MAKSKKKAPAVIAVLICACLLFAMYISLSTLTLGLWGQTVMGTVDSYDSRLDNTDAGQNRSRTISKGYYFMVNGKEYRGYVMYYSDESWPRLSGGETRSERISYFPFFPYINKPFALVDFDHMGEAALIYHTLSPVGCIILLLLVTGAFRRKKATRVKKVVAQQNVDRSDADMFCTNCGSRLPENAAFCSSCGAKILTSASRDCAACGATIPNDALFCINCGAAANTAGTPIEMSQSVHPQTYSAPQQHNSTQRTGLVGFSDLCNSREILVAAQKNKKSSIGCMWILVLVPLIGFPVAGLAMDDFPFGESLVIGIGIALVMLIVNLIALRRTRRPMWEGVVVDKYSKERSEQRGGDDDNYRTYTEYTTVIRTDAGKKKTIVEKDSGRHMYDYLAVGDRVRFHPKFGTYEKFDKSKDRIIYCNICSMMNPIQNDRCKRCSNLLFK